MVQGERNRSRVAEIYVAVDVTAADGAKREWRVASGYAIASDLVLTAGHVLDTSDAGTRVVHVRRLGDSAWVESGISVVWHRSDDRVDGALLRVSGAPWSGLPDNGAIRWGAAVPDEAVPCTAIGFPKSQARPDNVRDTEEVAGRVSPNTRAKSAGLVVDVESPPPTGPEPDPWRGLSGAALLSRGPRRVLGVVSKDVKDSGHRRLEVTPASALLGDPGFAAAIGRSRAEPVAADVSPPLDDRIIRDPYVELPERYAEAQLLAAQHGLVPFLGRIAELRALEKWCNAAPRFSIAVITGDAGSGKSRLAAELCTRMRKTHGWDAYLACPGSDSWSRIDPDWPLLLVFDYPEQMVPELVAAISRLANRRGPRPAARLLLVSRQAGRWSDDVDTDTDGLLTAATDLHIPLSDEKFTVPDRKQHAEAAVTEFARHAGIPAPAPPDVTSTAFGSPLLVHMAALLALHGEHVDHSSPGSLRDKLLDGLLGRERKRWRRQALLGSGLSGTTAQQAVALATLTGPDRAECRELLLGVPELADASAERRGQIADWLIWLYPARHGDGITPLRPDLVAERLLATTPELATLTARIAGLSDCTSAHMLAMLQTLRLATDHEPVPRQALRELLATRLHTLLQAAGSAREPKLYPAIDDCLRLFGITDQRLAAAAASRSSSPSIPTRLMLTLAQLTVTHRRDQASSDLESRDALSGALTDLASVLLTIKDHHQALPLAREAANIARELAAADPDKYRPRLPVVLQNLATALSETGAPEEALAVSEDSVALAVELAKTDLAGFGTWLPEMMKNLSQDLSAVGRHDDAIATAQQSVAMAVTIGLGPGVYEIQRANSQMNLAFVLARAGRKADALAVSQETVTYIHDVIHDQEHISGALADALAHALNNLSADLEDAGYLPEALTAMREALALYWQLAEPDTDRYASTLVKALRHLDQLLVLTGNPEDLPEALDAAQDRVDLSRLLTAHQPGDHRETLAESLLVLGIRHQQTSALEAAAAATREAEGIFRELAEESAHYQPRLAVALHYLCGYLVELADLAGAAEAGREAVKIRRGLCASQPDVRHRLDLIASLSNLGTAYIAQGERALAVEQCDEALAMARALHTEHPENHRAEIASSYNAIGAALGQAGNAREAMGCFYDALTIRRSLAEDGTDDSEVNLAQTLHNLATSFLGDDPIHGHVAAIPLLREALGIFIRHMSEGKVALLPRVLLTWQTLGKTLEMTGDAADFAYWAERVAGVLASDLDNGDEKDK